MKPSRLFHLSAIPAVGVVAALLLVGCGGSTSSGTVSAKPTVVRLLAHDSFTVSDTLKQEFEKDTGLTLEVVTAGDAGTMVAGAVLAAGSPTADVLFGVDNTLVARATKAGVFWPYLAPDASALLPALKSDTSGGLLTPVDYGDVCVNIDDAWFKANGLAVPKLLTTSPTRGTGTCSWWRIPRCPPPASPSCSPPSCVTARSGRTTGAD